MCPERIQEFLPLYGYKQEMLDILNDKKEQAYNDDESSNISQDLRLRDLRNKMNIEKHEWNPFIKEVYELIIQK